jgi:hypothetical protein
MTSSTHQLRKGPLSPTKSIVPSAYTVWPSSNSPPTMDKFKALSTRLGARVTGRVPKSMRNQVSGLWTYEARYEDTIQRKDSHYRILIGCTVVW